MRPNGGAAARRGGRAKITKNTGVTLKRLFSYIFKNYKGRFVLVIICILLSAVASVASSMFIKTLIDTYIEPLIGVPNPDFSGLLQAILMMAALFLVGIAATFTYTRTMVTISQGILRTIRVDMFSKLQTLPIRYFDTNSHGDIMSRFTNDTDTLRQMISQSIPQFLNSAVTIVAVFFAMLYTSVWLTLFVLAFLVIMLMVTAKVGGKSGKYFVKQQSSLGDVNGYIEEMINGQKVVKVFNHERKCEEEFDVKNEQLKNNATQANKFANILMPILMNLGNLQYILIAILGGALALGGVGGLTLGAIASFMTLSKSFTQPINQVSQQLNSIVMGSCWRRENI